MWNKSQKILIALLAGTLLPMTGCIRDLQSIKIEQLEFKLDETFPGGVLPEGKVNTPYVTLEGEAVKIRVSGGSGKYEFRVVDGKLPGAGSDDAYELDPNTGVISGKTLENGLFKFTIEARDTAAARDPVEADFEIRVWNRFFNAAFEEFHWKSGAGEDKVERHLAERGVGDTTSIQAQVEMADPQETVYSDSHDPDLLIEEIKEGDGPFFDDLNLEMAGNNPNWYPRLKSPDGYDPQGRPYFGKWRIYDPNEPEHEVIIDIHITTIGFDQTHLGDMHYPISTTAWNIGRRVNNTVDGFPVGISPGQPAGGGLFCLKLRDGSLPPGLELANKNTGQSGDLIQAADGNQFVVRGRPSDATDVNWAGFSLKIWEVSAGDVCDNASEENSLNFDTANGIILKTQIGMEFPGPAQGQTIMSAAGTGSQCVDPGDPTAALSGDCHPIGTAYIKTLSATGNADNPTRFRIVTGSLPTGMTFNTNTGALGGTPSQANYQSVIIEAYTQGFEKNSRRRTFQFNIGPNIKFDDPLAGLPGSGLVGDFVAGSDAVTLRLINLSAGFQDKTNVRFSVSEGSLPPGVSLDTNSSGTGGGFKGQYTNQGSGYQFTIHAQHKDYPANYANLEINFPVNLDIALDWTYPASDGGAGDCDSNRATNCDRAIGQDYPQPLITLSNPNGRNVKYRWSNLYSDPTAVGVAVDTTLEDTTGRDLTDVLLTGSRACETAFGEFVALEAYLSDPGLEGSVISPVWQMVCKRDIEFATGDANYDTYITQANSLSWAVGQPAGVTLRAQSPSNPGATLVFEWVSSDDNDAITIGNPLASGLSGAATYSGPYTDFDITGSPTVGISPTGTLYLRARMSAPYQDNYKIIALGGGHDTDNDLIINTAGNLGTHGVGEDLSISLSTSTAATANQEFSSTNLPAGLSLNASTGEITGALEDTGLQSFTVRASLESPYDGNFHEKAFDITGGVTIQVDAVGTDEIYLPWAQAVNHGFSASDTTGSLLQTVEWRLYGDSNLLTACDWYETIKGDLTNPSPHISPLETGPTTGDTLTLSGTLPASFLLGEKTDCWLAANYVGYENNKDARKFTFGSFRWKANSDELPGNLAWSAAATDPAGTVYLTGGLSASGTAANKVYSYSASGNASQLSGAGIDRAEHSALFIDSVPDYLFVHGGREADGTLIGTARKFNLSLNTWTSAASGSGPSQKNHRIIFGSDGNIYTLTTGGLYILSDTFPFNASADTSYSGDTWATWLSNAGVSTDRLKLVGYSATSPAKCFQIFHGDGHSLLYTQNANGSPCLSQSGDGAEVAGGLPPGYSSAGYDASSSATRGPVLSNRIDRGSGVYWVFRNFFGSGSDRHALLVEAGSDPRGLFPVDPLNGADGPPALRGAATGGWGGSLYILGGEDVGTAQYTKAVYELEYE